MNLHYKLFPKIKDFITIVQGLAASFALGSMCILTGLVFMVDATWSVLDILYMPKK